MSGAERQPVPMQWPGRVPPRLLSSHCAGRRDDGTLWWVAPGCPCLRLHHGKPCAQRVHLTPIRAWVCVEIAAPYRERTRVLILLAGLGSPARLAREIRRCATWAEVPLAVEAIDVQEVP